MSSLAAEGPAAPPRDNGELVFAAPWESQAFAMAVALEESGILEPGRFRSRLIDEIARWERLPQDERGPWRYYERWLTALESVLVESRVVEAGALRERAADLARHDAHDH